LIVDGTGRPGRVGSVAVDAGRIVAVGEAPTAARVWDGSGLVLAPGFIDLHTHSDFTLPRFPAAPAMIRQGVTTQVVGNCGFSPFPAPADRRRDLAAYTSFIDSGLDWERWEDAEGFVRHLEGLPLAGNVALQVGLGTVRFAVMGFERRSPRQEELSEMIEHVTSAFEAGVVGVSSGLTYAPGRYAPHGEIVRLVSVAREYGGFYSTHIRNEAGRLRDAVGEALETSRAAGTPLQLSHHKALGKSNWGAVTDTLAAVDGARHSGQDVLVDQYPYRAGSTAFTQVLPDWVLERGIGGMREAIRDPVQRARIVSAISDPGEDATRDFDPASILLAEIPDGPNRRFEGWYLADVAAELGLGPIDTALRLIDEEGTGILMVVFGMSEEDVRTVMRHPAVAVASDGWTLSPHAGGRPHPRSYGTFARVLGRYVREQGVLGLEEAVHKMTGLPSRRLPGFDRGLICEGSVADLVLFDPQRIIDVATFEDPHRFAEGVHSVFVRGVPVVEEGRETGATPGRVLRGGRRGDPVE
jgi:N-acyl-D-amino-acid deacylase